MKMFFKISCILLIGLSYITPETVPTINNQVSIHTINTPTYIPDVKPEIPIRSEAHCQSTFTHNFCESRLRGDNEPELLNAISSLAVTIVPFVSGFPTDPIFYNVACMLSINGLASFHYHYFLNWFGKQADEITMILATFFGTWGLIHIYYPKDSDRNRINRYNIIAMYVFLVSNTMMQFDPLFPSIFGIYVGWPLYLIYNIAQKHRVAYKANLFISLVGTLSWIVSEHFCTEITKYGHPIWHVLFPLGFYHILLNYDKLKTQIKIEHTRKFYL